MHFGEHQGCNQIIQKGYMRTEFIGMEKARKLLCIMGSCKKAVTMATMASQTVLNDRIYFSIITVFSYESFPMRQ